jgi:glyoxylase-like metal-dependent hydrolase (beta-lactamase superfamily II)
LADVYGPPDPVPPDRLVAHDQADLPGLVVLETPGHAPHHVSYEYGGRLMAGEAAGNLFVINDRQYMRPATPPRFFLTEAADSVRELRARPDQPILYAHYDWAPHSHALLDRFIDQLYRWEGIVETELGRMEDLDDEEAQIDRLIGALYRNDRELDAFEVMTESVQKRELHFMRNSVRGYMGYVAGKEPDKAG